MVEITPISGTATDWHRFVTGVNQAIGRSPTRELDNCGIQVGSPSTYLAALAEFTHDGSNPITIQKDADNILRHISYSFLVSCDKETFLQICKLSTGLIILSAEPTRTKENFIVTGNLRDWKTSIVEGCSHNQDTETREFFNSVWKLFETLGFKDLFSNYYRSQENDRTFSLLEKRKK